MPTCLLHDLRHPRALLLKMDPRGSTLDEDKPFPFNLPSWNTGARGLLAAQQLIIPVVTFMAHMRLSIPVSMFVLASICSSTSATPDQRAMPQTFSKLQSAAVNYADVRTRVAHAFAEKAHEMSAVITLLQTLSKETVALTETIHTHCGAKMSTVPIARSNALRG